MSFCSYSKGGAMYDTTPIENMFLLEYLPTAPEGFLRVYLYARMLCIHPELGDSLADMARGLRMDEESVFNALSYWEQQGLIERLTDRPPTYAVLPLRSGDCVGGADHDFYTYREYNSSLQDIFGAADLLEPKQYALANDWLNVLGFEQDAALQLLTYAKGLPGGKKPASVFKRADKLAVDWADRGIKTTQQVRDAIARDDRVNGLCRRVLQQLGIRRGPSIDEAETVRRWIEQWKLTDDDVIAACGDTTKSRSPSIGYLDAILKSRMEDGSNVYFDAVKQVLQNLGVANATPTPEQKQQYGSWLDRGFDADVIGLAAAQCARKGRHLFSDVEWMLDKWEEKGIKTRDRAEKYMADMRSAMTEMYTLLERAGLSRRPTLDDVEMFDKWKGVHPRELIDCAAELSRGTKAPIRYMDRLLDAWAKAGIRDPETARGEHAAFVAARSRTNQANKFDYQQHTYTEADFGPDFFYDPLKDMPQEGDEQ